MKRKLTLLSIALLVVMALTTAASASFVTFVADSFYNAKNYGEAFKQYNRIAVQYYDNATKPEVVSYLFGYESTKKIYVNRATDAAKVALYCCYMQALSQIYQKDYAGAINSVSLALSCFNLEKTLTPKSLTSAGKPEVIKITLPANIIAEYTAKISALPLPPKDMLAAMAKTARERLSVEIALVNTPPGPAYDQLMAKFIALVETEKTYAEFIVNVISRDLDVKNFTSFEILVGFMKAYAPIDRSASSLLDVSDKVIRKMTAITLGLEGTDIALATQYGVKMQLLISVNAYIKSYLATAGR